MGTKQRLRFGQSLLFFLALVLPGAGALTWTVFPSLKVVTAAWTFPSQQFDNSSWESPQTGEQMRRTIQKHFLQYKQYIPLDDIVITPTEPTPNEKKLLLMMSKSCGNARVYTWLPLMIHLPFLGTRVWEWCWKPKITIIKSPS